MLLNDVNSFLCKQVSTVLPPLSPDRLRNYSKENKRIEIQSKPQHSLLVPLLGLEFVNNKSLRGWGWGEKYSKQKIK